MKREPRRSAYAKNDDPNYYDYIVKPKVKGKLLVKRLLFILAYIAFAVAFSAVCFAIKFIPLMCLVLVLTLVVIFFTWRYVNPEYVYSLERSNISFSIIYGGLTRKDLFTYHIKDIEKIAPYSGEYKAEADGITDAERVYHISSMDAYDIYYIYATGEDGKKRLVFFEATEQSKKLLRYYNDKTVILKQSYL
ncbi:MAG: hypothetical protein J6A83_00405 [Clostridia bacterium]|nr:hypothetical protein [Clostridia bacterium]